MALKPGLGVTQGHRNRHVPTRHLRFSINVQWQLWAYLISFPRWTAISVENRKIFPPHVFCTPAEGFSLELGTGTWGQKTRMMGLLGPERNLTIS